MEGGYGAGIGSSRGCEVEVAFVAVGLMAMMQDTDDDFRSIELVAVGTCDDLRG